MSLHEQLKAAKTHHQKARGTERALLDTIIAQLERDVIEQPQIAEHLARPVKDVMPMYQEPS